MAEAKEALKTNKTTTTTLNLMLMAGHDACDFKMQ